jgi:hypothetical protein
MKRTVATITARILNIFVSVNYGHGSEGRAEARGSVVSLGIIRVRFL